MPSALASHYAEALADAIFGANSGLPAEEAVKQLVSAEEVITSSKQLQIALLSPAVNRARKQAVISALSEQLGIHRLIRNFLLVAVSHRRISDLKMMRQALEEIVDARLGWIRAEIASAHEMATTEREEVERALGEKLGKFVRATYVVDASLIGGIRARVASREYDATVRGKLDNMRQRLASNR